MAAAVSFRKFLRTNKIDWAKDGKAKEYVNSKTGVPFHVFHIDVDGEHAQLTTSRNVGDIPDVETLKSRVKEDDLQVLYPDAEHQNYCLCLPGDTLNGEETATSEELFGDIL